MRLAVLSHTEIPVTSNGAAAPVRVDPSFFPPASYSLRRRWAAGASLVRVSRKSQPRGMMGMKAFRAHSDRLRWNSSSGSPGVLSELFRCVVSSCLVLLITLLLCQYSIDDFMFVRDVHVWKR